VFVRHCTCTVIDKLCPVNLYLHRSFVASLALLLALDVSYAFDKVPEFSTTIAAGVCFGVASLMLLINLFCWITIGIPLGLSFLVGLVFDVGNVSIGSTSNRFLKFTKGEKLSYVNTDLSTYVFAAQLEMESSFTVMFYTTSWANRFGTGVGQPIGIWVGFAACFVVRVASSPVGYEWVALFGVWFVGLIVYALLRCLGPVLWALSNVLFCCLPNVILKKTKEWVVRTVLAHINEHEALDVNYSTAV